MATSRNSVDFFCEPPAEDFLCSICTEVFDEPLLLPCRHTFCGVCIRSTIEKSGAGKPTECPLCREEFQKKELRKPQINFQGLLNNLRMKCQNKECGAELKMEDYWTHNAKCDFGSVDCPFAKCGKKLFRKDLENHKTTCEYRDVPCRKGCGETIQHRDFNHHFYNECRLGKRVCDKCQGKYNYRERDQHDCIKQLVDEIKSLKEQMKCMSTGIKCMSTGIGHQGKASTTRPPRSARFITSFNARIPGDQEGANSRDILLMPGNFILYTDVGNSCLKQFDEKGGFLCKIPTEDGACKLAHLGNDKVALLNIERKTLEVLKVSPTSIIKENTSQVDKKYFSIDALDSQTIVAVPMGVSGMDILTLDGQVLRSIATSSVLGFVSLCTSGYLMCYCVHENPRSVLKINAISGVETLKKPVAGAEELFGIATTRDNSCIVCDSKKKVLYLLDTDGNLIKTLWSVPEGDNSGPLLYLSVLDNMVVCCTFRTVFVLELLY